MRHHEFVDPGDRGLVLGSSVVEREAFLGHLPESVESPGIDQAVPQRHLVPGCSFPFVDLSRARYSSAGDFFKVIEIAPYQDVIRVEAFLCDFPPDGCPLVGDVLCIDVDDG
jgi:hypothetical protein